MSRDYNRITLIGHVGKDPEMRYTQAGVAIASFSLATGESWTGKDGQKQERTEWHRVSAFGKVAEIIEKYVNKGKQLMVVGKLQYDEWEKDGVKQRGSKIVVSGPGTEILLLGGGGNGSGREGAEDAEDAEVAEAPRRSPTPRRDPPPQRSFRAEPQQEFQATDADVPF
jgi:single-strand DNA-binding protein